MNSQSLLEHIEIETAPNPRCTVIWLHGLGANGYDFCSLVTKLSSSCCVPTRFILPHAPLRPVTINGGRSTRAWYDILDRSLTQEEDRTGLTSSATAIQDLIQRENSRGIPNNCIVLGGFSQGCAMVVYTGIRVHKKLAGIIGVSGYTPLLDRALEEHSSASLETPIFLAHGLNDVIISPENAQNSRVFLERLGYKVQWHTYPIQHSICTQEINDISTFLYNTLIGKLVVNP